MDVAAEAPNPAVSVLAHVQAVEPHGERARLARLDDRRRELADEADDAAVRRLEGPLNLPVAGSSVGRR